MTSRRRLRIRTPAPVSRRQMRDFGRRTGQVLGLSAVTGVVVGFAVAAYEAVVAEELLPLVLEAPLAVKVLAPLVGLAMAALILRTLGGGASPATADEYVRNFHDQDRRLDLRAVPARLLASVTTLGFGGALGLEGPSIYLGAATGTGLQARLSRLFSREDAKLLMVAGASAGVAAIFKTPATGAIFALEVPYQDDTARRHLLPALVGAVSSYVTFVLIVGTEPLFPVSGLPPFDLRDLGGAALLGLLCGLGARLMARLVRWAKDLSVRTHPVLRVLGGGLLLGGLALASQGLTGEDLTLGPGYAVFDWLREPDTAVGVLLAVLGLRVLATVATIGAGGVGGLFIPLVVAGALLGRATGEVVGVPNDTLFPLVGVAAFLGAGYRTPLAGIMFVAESTGRPGFVVPGVIAAVVAQLAMGRESVTPHQVAGRLGHLERRFTLPVASVIRSEVRTVPSDTTLREFFDFHLLLDRRTTVPVVDGQEYRGLVSVDDLATVDQERWEEVQVGEVATDPARAAPGWQVSQAVRAMERADLDVLPVVDRAGRFVGVVTTGEILRLDDILARTEDANDP